MTHMRALSILSGLTPVADEDEAMAVLAWADQHPEELTTGSLQVAVERLAWMLEVGDL